MNKQLHQNSEESICRSHKRMAKTGENLNNIELFIGKEQLEVAPYKSMRSNIENFHYQLQFSSFFYSIIVPNYYDPFCLLQPSLHK